MRERLTARWFRARRTPWRLELTKFRRTSCIPVLVLGLNPVGWNYWHALRVWDLDLNWLIKGQKPDEDAWHRGEFTARSGYDPDGIGLRGSGIGLGYSDAEVDALASSAPTSSRSTTRCCWPKR